MVVGRTTHMGRALSMIDSKKNIRLSEELILSSGTYTIMVFRAYLVIL